VPKALTLTLGEAPVTGMKSWQTTYWKYFNLVGRFVGYVFMIAGIIIALCGLIPPRDLHTDPSNRWLGSIAGLIIAVLGFLTIKAKPYDPRKPK
jgi:uncharacterized membrane protein